jgi:hypothetical protein
MRTTTANPNDIAEIVEGLRHRLGGDEPADAPSQDAGAWPADPKATGERSMARHAKNKPAAVRMAADLGRRPEVAVPVAIAVVAAGVGIGLAARK